MLVDELARYANIHELNMYRICEVDNGNYNIREICPAGLRQNVYSVSKSVTSLLIGILIGQGKLSLSDTVTSALYSDCTDMQAQKWSKITLHHLLTHTTGHANGLLDIDQPGFVSPSDGNYLQAVLSAPLCYQPGEKMVYSDSNYYLAACMAERASGMSLFDFARQSLFTPMGMYGTAWQVCPEGHCMGATGLVLSIMDMAKLGVLVMNDGQWQGNQLVPAEWIHLAASPHAQPDDPKSFYGYGFWGIKGDDTIIANGMLGQLIAVFPTSRRVIAWQSCTESTDIGKITEIAMRARNKLC